MQIGQAITRRRSLIDLGTYGHLAVFLWLLAMGMTIPQDKLLLGMLVCLTVVAGLYPTVFRRLFKLRLLLLGLLVTVPPIFMMGETDGAILGLPYSSEGLAVGLNAGVRFIVVLLAVYSFTESVDIPSLAGTLERFGLQGLGFSIGVALNLVPSLRDSAFKSWYSLKMRGGFRKQWMRGIQLYLVVVITNALRQAEEIALAAEARAFSPDKSQPMAIKKCKLDRLVCPLCLLSFVFVLIWS